MLRTISIQQTTTVFGLQYSTRVTITSPIHSKFTRVFSGVENKLTKFLSFQNNTTWHCFTQHMSMPACTFHAHLLQPPLATLVLLTSTSLPLTNPQSRDRREKKKKLSYSLLGYSLLYSKKENGVRAKESQRQHHQREGGSGGERQGSEDDEPF